ncbi:MAG: protein kinase [Planctomycetota bacterium]
MRQKNDMKCGQCGFESEQSFAFCPSCGTQAAAGGDAGIGGRVLNGKYRVLSELGAGSMGTVYLAEHVALKKKVAIKVLHRELQLGDEAMQRFQREGIAAGQISHPNVIQIFDFDRTDEGTCFLAMELVDGENLKELLAREGALETETAVGLARQLLQTLAEAHRHGVVHRDLKPENLMVVRGVDDTLALKVLDFGLSKLVDRRFDASLQTMSGRVMGTPLYMAPEQWRGEEVDARSELYAASLILYEMLTGHQPFKGADMTEMLMRSTTEAPPSVLDHATKHPVPVDLDPLLRRGMAKDRDERFEDAAAMLEELDDVRLDRVQRGSSSTSVRRRSSRSQTATQRSAKRGRSGRAPAAASSRTPLVLAGVGAAVAIGALVWMFGFGGGEADEAQLVRDIPRENRSNEQQDYIVQIESALDRLRTGQLAAAMSAADKAVRMPVADAEAYCVRARIYERQRDPDTAMLDFQEAEKRLPGYAPAVAGIGWLLFERGEFENADQRFRAAMARDDTCGEAFAGAAAVLLEKGAAADALELLRREGSKVQEHPLVLVYRGEALLGEGRLDDALTSFRQAKRGDSSLWRAYRGLAVAFDRKGDPQAAERECGAGLAMADHAVSLRQLHAELLIAQERYQEAQTELALLRPKTGDVLVLEGLAEQGLSNSEQAIAAWQRAGSAELAVKPSSPAQVQLLLATEHARQQQWQQSLACAVRAEELDSELPRAAFYRGLASYRLDQHAEAAEGFARAVELDGADLLARYTLGVLYMDYLGRPDDAIEQFAAYQDAGGADPKVAGFLSKLRRR